jgi:hypothetical protein
VWVRVGGAPRPPRPPRPPSINDSQWGRAVRPVMPVHVCRDRCHALAAVRPPGVLPGAGGGGGGVGRQQTHDQDHMMGPSCRLSTT